MIRTYTKLIKLNTFIERYRYLKLNGSIGRETFGFDRHLNQQLYTSPRWRSLRDYIIVRDNGCDLGITDREVQGILIVHHLNEVTIDDIYNNRPYIFDPDNLICTSINTHNAIHYGDEGLLIKEVIERKPNDTILW